MSSRLELSLEIVNKRQKAGEKNFILYIQAALSSWSGRNFVCRGYSEQNSSSNLIIAVCVLTS